MFTSAMILKLAGAALAFAAGLWIGMGMPGLERGHRKSRGWSREDRLKGTWLNRVFFGMPNPPRRFDSSRLIRPDDGNGEERRRRSSRFRVVPPSSAED